MAYYPTFHGLAAPPASDLDIEIGPAVVEEVHWSMRDKLRVAAPIVGGVLSATVTVMTWRSGGPERVPVLLLGIWSFLSSVTDAVQALDDIEKRHLEIQGLR